MKERKNPLRKILSTAGLLIALTFNPISISKGFSEMENIYNNSFNIPIYLKDNTSSLKNNKIDSKQMNIQVNRDADSNAIEIIFKNKDLDYEVPKTARISLYPKNQLIAHPKGIEINSVEQELNKRENEEERGEKLVHYEKGLFEKGIDYLFQEKLEGIREKQKKEILSSIKKGDYELTKIPPYVSEESISGGYITDDLKYSFSVDYGGQSESQKIFLIPGMELRRNISPELIGNLEKRVIIPISLE